MRIAQVAPLFESVPPRLYGGTERVVSFLTEELVNRGHDVTLFASGDSCTRARLVAPCAEALRLNGHCKDPVALQVLLVEKVIQQADDFDFIHFHTEHLHFPSVRRNQVPHVTTLHGRLDIPEIGLLYREFSDMPVVSISDSQREPLSWANWQATIHHGLPPDLFRLNKKPRQYLAFLGRVSQEKRPDTAIRIAHAARVPLKIAAKLDGERDKKYFEKEVRPLLDSPYAELVGEVSESEKQEFLGNAMALLFPIAWPEPFGLVMIEAMACGTPVIAYRQGSVPEIVRDGENGFVVGNLNEAVAAVERAASFDRRRCREYFERKFTASRMADQYLRVYEKLSAVSEVLHA